MSTARSAAINKWRGRSVKDAVLSTAGRLFYSKGISNVGIDQLVSEADITRGTLYRHYKGKVALVSAYLEERHAATLQLIVQQSSQAVGPAAKIEALFDHLHSRISRPGFRGCAFCLALGELGSSPVVRQQVASHKNEVRRFIRNTLEQGAVDDFDAKADVLMILYEGVLTAASVGNITDSAVKARSLVRSILHDRAETPAT